VAKAVSVRTDFSIYFKSISFFWFSTRVSIVFCRQVNGGRAPGQCVGGTWQTRKLPRQKSTLQSHSITKFEKVGLLDVDLTGPSVPRLVGLASQAVHKASTGCVFVKKMAPK
jgi:hypothetical protein